MSRWSDLGLPSPSVQGYGYSIDSGLDRTTGDTEHPRQDQRYEANRRTFTLSFTLSDDQLKVAEDFLYSEGFMWFTIDLISGEDTNALEPIIVRLVDYYSVDSIWPGGYRLSATVEQKVLRSHYATSVLYPLENFEYSSTSAPAPMTTHLWEQVRYLEDWASTSVPTIVSATLDRTVFHADGILPGPFPWDYAGHGWGRNADLDAAITSAPRINLSVGNFLLSFLSAADSTETLAPELSAIDLVRTIFLAYILQDDEARGDKAATLSPSVSPMVLVQTMFRHDEECLELSQAGPPSLSSFILAQVIFNKAISQFDYSGSLAPSIVAMTLVPLTRHLSLWDYSETAAPSIGSFALVDLRGSLKVTVLRSVGGTAVPGATVEIS